jgi:hypothetical protein
MIWLYGYLLVGSVWAMFIGGAIQEALGPCPWWRTLRAFAVMTLFWPVGVFTYVKVLVTGSWRE